MTRTGGCDGCRARAEVDVYLPGGRLLELCGPHGRRHQSALRAQGALVVGRFRVVQLPSRGPYEGADVEREFRRLAVSAELRTRPRLNPTDFLHSSEQVRVHALRRLFGDAWQRLAGRPSNR
ncbi:MAG: hypothetical protein QOE76_3564 [Frankiales bacterium]|jgi:hypothetical protein|nr:hypothetical protein [Frankiales bacterium]